MALEIDLDVLPARVSASKALVRLPWILLAVAVIALLAAIAGLLRQPEAQTSQQPLPVAQPDPTIDASWSARAVESPGLTELRDAAGRVLAVVLSVRPFAGEPVWCRLGVGDAVVENYAEAGAPAICLWVRGAVSNDHR
jgi:hypothetical protein